MSEDSLLEFPCDLPIKIFGRNTDSFRELVLGIIGSHFGAPSEQRIREKLSRNNGYTSLTITVRAESREQVDALYQELSSSDDVMMVL
jgi:putative lipoic acid-binding regulatory protein